MSSTVKVAVQRIGYHGGVGPAECIDVPVECPVSMVFGGIPHVVVMASPDHIEDLVAGFCLTEGIVRRPDECRALSVNRMADQIVVRLDLVPDAMTRFLARRRSLSGRTSCGLCGIESLEQMATARPVAPGAAIRPEAIRQALDALESAQDLNRLTRAVHAAGWFSAQGAPLVVREDVGRHNALDKMIGACLRQGLSPQDGFAVITSRCSYEMVEKAAGFGAAVLVAVSGPTSLAIERARRLGVALIAVARADGALAFTDTTAPEQAA